MHNFFAGDRTAGGPKGLEAEHRMCDPFHRSMILLHEVIEILGVADNDGGLMGPVVACNRCRIRPTLIDSDFLWESLIGNGFT